jgi:hypothetical protein
MADLLHSWGPANVATLLTTTIENRKGEIQDNIFNDLVTVKYLREKNKISLSGGASIVQPLMYEKNTTASFYQGYDPIDTSPQEGYTAAQYTWKEAAASISLSNREENIQNTGKEAVYSIVNAKINQAEMSLKDVLNTGFFAASPGSKDIGSLVTQIDATSTIGDINSTTYSWWQSTVTSGGSFAGQGRRDMVTTWNTLVAKGAKPDLLLTTPTVHGYYEASLIPQLRYTSVDEGNLSFKSLMFKTSPVVFDTAATSGVMYFLDSRHLELCIHSGNDFRMTEWVKPSNQTARVAQLIIALELCTNNRRRLGKITGITA